MEALAAEIIQYVKDHNGIKLSELLYQVSKEIDRTTTLAQMEKLIAALIEQKKLIEIEYSIDLTGVSSFILPAKTQLNIRGQEPKAPHRI